MENLQRRVIEKYLITKVKTENKQRKAADKLRRSPEKTVKKFYFTVPSSGGTSGGFISNTSIALSRSALTIFAYT